MKHEKIIARPSSALKPNRLAYALYLVLVAYQLSMGDIDWAVVNFGISMAFDPFDPTVKWNDRPRYQRVWLYLHVALSLAGFLYLAFR